MSWIAAGIAAVAGIVTTLIANDQQKKENKRAADRNLEANRKLIEEQNLYNSPEEQMKRYKQANLNTNLIYGNGTASAGNQTQTATRNEQPPAIKSFQQVTPDTLEAYNQTRLVNSQVQATDASTVQRTTQAALNKLQGEVIKKNPLLDDAGFKAIIDGLVSTATIKGNEADMSGMDKNFKEITYGNKAQMVFTEMKILDQKYDLSILDNQQKAELVKSSKFKNDLIELQQKFMKDGEWSSGMVMQFIQQVLLKFL